MTSSTESPDPKPESTEPAAAPPHEPHEAAEGSADDAGGDDADTGAAEGTEGAEATAEGGPAGEKKKPEGAEGATPGTPGEAHAEGAEGAAPGAGPGDAKEGGRTGEPQRPRKEKRPRRPDENRERPAFGVGDVVFGKIIEITDDVLFVDLSGKGHAIFDRHELLLPDEPAQGPGSAVLDDDDDFLPPKPVEKDETAEAEAAPPPAEEVAAAPEARIIVAAGAMEPAPAPPADAAEAKAPSDETPAPAPHAPTPPREEPHAAVTLPPVVLELGANFVAVVHNDGGRGGLVVLTRHPRRGRHAKPLASKAFVDKSLIAGLVTGVIRGGVEVDIDGLRAFAPGSHMDVHHGADLRPLVGKRLQFHVTQYAKRGKDIVLSRRSMIEAEAKVHREVALKQLVPGNIVEGIVRSVVSFGAFVDVGGVEGLVPLQEMSHNRNDAPNDVFTVGETIEVQVQRIDVKGKIWLSRKGTLPDPWASVAAKYAEGTRHKGTVARLQPFGAFIELESGIDGLIHSSDLSLKRIDHPSEVVKVGDEIEVIVASVDSSSHKIALHPIPEGFSADEPFQKVAPHKNVRVVVTGSETGGVFVRILGATGRSARGFITAAGTGTPRGTEFRKMFPPGKQLEARVVEIDPRRGEVKLSIKAMTEDTERSAYKAYRQKVTQEAKFGTFGDLLKKATEKD